MRFPISAEVEIMSMSSELSGITRDKKEENFFLRLVKYFIPWKGDGVGEIMRKFVFAASIVFFCISVQAVVDYYQVDTQEVERQQEIAQMAPVFPEDDVVYDVPEKDDDKEPEENEKPDDSKEEEKPAEISPQWDALLKQNKDTIGWIKIPTFADENGDLYVNYPVMQSERQYELSNGSTEDWYLHHNFDNHWNESGTIYADWRVPITSESSHADNIVIYGHHMKRLGNMFTRLAEYKSGVDFLKQNPIISFDTLYTKNQKYIIIGCYIASINEDQDNGNLFDYWRYRNFDEDHPFETFISEIRSRSWYSSDIECNEDDDYITLSTCSNEAGNGKLRWVITARRVKPTDDIDALINSYKEKENGDIYFPRNWINSVGNKKKYDGWWF